jgi:hypothetical protein
MTPARRSKALASFRSSVSKPSVNQPWTERVDRRAASQEPVDQDHGRPAPDCASVFGALSHSRASFLHRPHQAAVLPVPVLASGNARLQRSIDAWPNCAAGHHHRDVRFSPSDFPPGVQTVRHDRLHPDRARKPAAFARRGLFCLYRRSRLSRFLHDLQSRRSKICCLFIGPAANCILLSRALVPQRGLAGRARAAAARW